MHTGSFPFISCSCESWAETLYAYNLLLSLTLFPFSAFGGFARASSCYLWFRLFILYGNFLGFYCTIELSLQVHFYV
jgi:hypothetical protein